MPSVSPPEPMVVDSGQEPDEAGLIPLVVAAQAKELAMRKEAHAFDLEVPSQTRPAPAVQSSPPSGPSTVAQVIAAASAAPVPHPAPTAASSTSPTPDEGPDIADIISATEQMDINNAACFQAEFFGKALVLLRGDLYRILALLRLPCPPGLLLQRLALRLWGGFHSLPKEPQKDPPR
ncbi:uncharacterized protein EDB91DRAFT_1086883 [Suillus paluster]|uniref:uncharacterized protein n=1 Tax=Suillus paluster TaxID=48578 RepID=UPI001B86A9AF|nr:uncharacterized protein EDB91DRAFT_1086883 [Suillus paluster]KAG1726062.1 hypothetical protein EDB91DRAFT_1086883 [Suillus paluster]